MTSVTHPAERIAESVVEMLVERLDGFDGPPRTVTIQGALVERESAAPPA
jgi:DNA-binding LacI/PurR family transcriptional regulator